MKCFGECASAPCVESRNLTKIRSDYDGLVLARSGRLYQSLDRRKVQNQRSSFLDFIATLVELLYQILCLLTRRNLRSESLPSPFLILKEVQEGNSMMWET